MIVNLETGEEFDRLNQRLAKTAESLLNNIEPIAEDELIEAGQDIAGPGYSGPKRIYRLTEGNLQMELDGRILYYAEPGEIIGLDSCIGCAIFPTHTDFAVRADIYDWKDVLSLLAKNPDSLSRLLEYQGLYSSQLSVILGGSLAVGDRPNFRFNSYAPGKDIITQGDMDTDVFSMLSGKAEVYVDEQLVAQIGENEIFGEMSRLTGEARSATVRAKTACEVCVFSGDDFSKMAENNPAALMDIARNLSERLAALNKEIAQAQ